MSYGSKGAYPFKEKARQYRGYTAAQLAFALSDIKDTIAAWPDGPNAGWYADDMHTVAAEIKRRDKAEGVCPHCGRS
jgi:hypothetical protein